MAVMINENSASASEILAAAMQDYRRAVIVGSTSWGKGTVQKMRSLDDVLDPLTRLQLQNDTSGADGQYIGAIKITEEKFYRVNGGSTQLKGVTPDIVLPDVFELEDEDMGERHNKAALKWDEIPPVAKLNAPDHVGNLDQLNSLSRSRIKSNMYFKLMDENAEMVKQRRDNKVVPLKESAFKKEQDEMIAMSKKLEEAQKKTDPMELYNPQADMDRINMDSTSINKNKEWLKNLGKDVYISETANIIRDMEKQEMHVGRNNNR
jgi:carboxyl-terminal processing protease